MDKYGGKKMDTFINKINLIMTYLYIYQYFTPLFYYPVSKLSILPNSLCNPYKQRDSENIHVSSFYSLNIDSVVECKINVSSEGIATYCGPGSGFLQNLPFLKNKPIVGVMASTSIL